MEIENAELFFTEEGPSIIIEIEITQCQLYIPLEMARCSLMLLIALLLSLSPSLSLSVHCDAVVHRSNNRCLSLQGLQQRSSLRHLTSVAVSLHCTVEGRSVAIAAGRDRSRWLSQPKNLGGLEEVVYLRQSKISDLVISF